MPDDSLIKTEEYGDIARKFNYFKNKMEQYLPGFEGITGTARVVDGTLAELTITIHSEFNSTAELIQFIQYGATIIPEYFPEDYQLNLYVYSVDRPQAIYVQRGNGENFIHIFRD